ncbi:hypothetical protein SHXM_03911 [Streptomyces hygroscopicus]|nr:hypothetical protein SHXM_03911 [Streptomyces hygroscopicus]
MSTQGVPGGGWGHVCDPARRSRAREAATNRVRPRSRWWHRRRSTPRPGRHSRLRRPARAWRPLWPPASRARERRRRDGRPGRPCRLRRAAPLPAPSRSIDMRLRRVVGLRPSPRAGVRPRLRTGLRPFPWCRFAAAPRRRALPRSPGSRGGAPATRGSCKCMPREGAGRGGAGRGICGSAGHPGALPPGLDRTVGLWGWSHIPVPSSAWHGAAVRPCGQAWCGCSGRRRRRWWGPGRRPGGRVRPGVPYPGRQQKGSSSSPDRRHTARPSRCGPAPGAYETTA